MQLILSWLVRRSFFRFLDIFKGGYLGSEDYEPINLGMKKRIAVRKYKGHSLIDIREMYEKDGEEKPGKKGISLNLTQFNTIKVRCRVKLTKRLIFYFRIVLAK